MDNRKLMFEEVLELSDDFYSLAFYGYYLNNCENERQLSAIEGKKYDEVLELLGEKPIQNEDALENSDIITIQAEKILRKERNEQNFFRVMMVFLLMLI